MAIEKVQPALLLAGDGDWKLTVAPGDDLVLGRGEESAKVIPHIAAARRHVRVVHTGDRCTIEDLGSSGGTYLNGQLVRKPTAIAEGDVIAIGPFRVSVSAVR